MIKTHLKLKIGDLKENERNPKNHNDKLIRDSIEEVGFLEDIICDENNQILAGHGRLKALKDLGYEEIDVIKVEGLTEKQKEKYLLLANKSVESGGWNNDLLKEFDKDLLKAVGFNDFELDNLFGVQEDDFDAQKEYEAIKEPITKLGDLYELGNHKIFCGDSTLKESYEKLIGGILARLIFTDPPYGVNYKSPGGLDYSSTKFGGTGGKIFNDNKTQEESLEFYTDILKRLFEFSRKDVSIYWWYATKNSIINRLAFKNANWHISQEIIWLKNGPVFSAGQDYHRRYEPCIVGWKEKEKHYKNVKYAKFQDVINLDYDDFQTMIDVWYEKRDITSKYIHPTQKPVRLAERALKKNSENGDIVLDVFLGSASTLIACEQIDRKCYGIELDPKFVDVEVKRYCQFVNNNEIVKNGQKMVWEMN